MHSCKLIANTHMAMAKKNNNKTTLTDLYRL